jgi:hypothetical protein
VVIVLLAALALPIACGDDAAPTPSPPAPAPATDPDTATATDTDTDTATAPRTATPSLSLAGAPTCTVSRPHPLGLPPTPTTTLAIEISPTTHHGILFLSRTRDRADVLPIDHRGRPLGPASSIPVAAATHLLSLDPIGPVTFIALTHSRCPDRPDHCLFAQLIRSAPGAPVVPSGELLTTHTTEPIRLLKKALLPDGLLLLRSHATAPPAIDRFRLSADGSFTHDTPVIIPPASADPDAPTGHEPLAIAADSATGRFAALIRHGFLEDERSEILLLIPPHPPAPIEALHHALAIDSFSFLDGSGTDSAAFIASFETSRPIHTRVSPTGDPLGRPLVLRRDIPLPPPFTDRLTGSLGTDGTTLVLRRRDAAGDPIGRPTPITTLDDPDITPVDLAWTGNTFLVALARAGRVETLSIACAPAP